MTVANRAPMDGTVRPEHPGRPPFVSVIVPVYNDHARLQACLDALSRQTYPADSYEIIVVDNGSDQPAAGAVRLPVNASVLTEDAVGSYVARNRGIAAARGTIIGFTDSDCIPRADWIANAVRLLEQDAAVGLLAGRIDVPVPQGLAGNIVALYDSLHAFPQQRYVEKDGFGATANVFTRLDVIERVGAFDSGLQSGGDAEWGRRVGAAGFALHYSDSVVVTHPPRTSIAALRQKALRVASGLHAQARTGRIGRSRLATILLRSSIPSVSEALRIMRTPSLGRMLVRVRVLFLLLYMRWFFCAALARFSTGLERSHRRFT